VLLAWLGCLLGPEQLWIWGLPLWPEGWGCSLPKALYWRQCSVSFSPVTAGTYSRDAVYLTVAYIVLSSNLS